MQEEPEGKGPSSSTLSLQPTCPAWPVTLTATAASTRLHVQVLGPVSAAVSSYLLTDSQALEIPQM